MATAKPNLPPAEPGVVLQRKDCAQLFILYAGRTLKVIESPFDFMAETGLVGRNIAIIRDLHQADYQRGVSAAVNDIPTFLKWQAQLVATLPHVREIYCVGSSAGAYAALISGHALKAKAVWSFAPLVPVQVSRRNSYLDPTYSDASQVLTHGNGLTEYNVYYNLGSEEDTLSAQRLEGLPGVRLFPQRGTSHTVVRDMIENGSLRGLLPEFVGVP